jgi:hypothetical protein
MSNKSKFYISSTVPKTQVTKSLGGVTKDSTVELYSVIEDAISKGFITIPSGGGDNIYTADGTITSGESRNVRWETSQPGFVSGYMTFGLNYWTVGMNSPFLVPAHVSITMPNEKSLTLFTSAAGAQFNSIQMVGDTGITITDNSTFKGMVYAADYSVNFEDNSLISKKYADPLRGTSNPALVIPPRRSGDIFIDEANNNIYIAAGTTVADWIKVN